jgi:hypothetical protein
MGEVGWPGRVALADIVIGSLIAVTLRQRLRFLQRRRIADRLSAGLDRVVFRDGAINIPQQRPFDHVYDHGVRAQRAPYARMPFGPCQRRVKWVYRGCHLLANLGGLSRNQSAVGAFLD